MDDSFSEMAPSGEVPKSNSLEETSKVLDHYKSMPVRTAGESREGEDDMEDAENPTKPPSARFQGYPRAVRPSYVPEGYDDYETDLEDDLPRPPPVHKSRRDSWASSERQNKQNIEPALNYVAWEDYNLPVERVFAIDVLADEPVPHAPGPGKSGAAQPRNLKAPQPLEKPREDHAHKTSQRPQLPERIRINSRPLIRELVHTANARLNQYRSAVIVRPFRFLYYHRNELQSYYLSSKAKLDNLGTQQGHQENATETVVSASKSTAADEELRPTTSGSNATSSTGFTDVDEEATRHLECLMEFIEGTLNPYVHFLRSIECQKVSFADLWFVFQPGDEVYNEAAQQAYKIMSVDGAGHRAISHRGSRDEQYPVTISCIMIDFNGTELGPVQSQFRIGSFDGLRSVNSLPVYPLRGELRERLIARGSKFFHSTTVLHMHYQGPTVDRRDEIDSQVVVDFEEAYSALQMAAGSTRDVRPRIENMVGHSFGHPRRDEPCFGSCCRDQAVMEDRYIDQNLSEDHFATLMPQNRSVMWPLAIQPRPRTEAQIGDNSIKEWEFVIMTRRIWAFVMRSRKWRELDVTHLTSIERYRGLGSTGPGAQREREHAFDQLVLPDGHKPMVKSLIAQHFRDKQASTEEDDYSDIVRGKGKGLVILLHGAPGVGKTTTAECVAEYFQKPLFQITCGDLGVWASDVEKALDQNFSLANRWGCILLLDEADVFLAARTPTDMLRNGLVSVFLRILEYYSGVLFLTTNRVGDFDEAFASRIHMSLYYPPLSKEATEAIFDLNINRIKKKMAKSGRKINVKDTSIAVFASEYWHEYPKARWNGRQIRNACHTAAALAEFEAQGGDDETPEDSQAVINLEVKHFEKVANAYLGFSEYLRDIYGVDADERAKENFLRASQREPPAAAQPLLLRRNEAPPSRPRQSYGRHDYVPPRRETSGLRPGYGDEAGYEHQQGPNMQQQFPSSSRRGAAHESAIPPPRPPPKPENLRRFSYDSESMSGQQMGGNQDHFRPARGNFGPIYEDTDRSAMLPQASDERLMYRSSASAAPDEASGLEPALHWSRRRA
ncbi:hypothetical protein PG985_014431 [Apiospora marii]|uniref:uncharacterized protein n=1 Tax=Apiospora marii TaxID=335849 RepID=UPI00312D125B